MKLRNKKTGEIIRFYDGITLNGEDYDSLAELNEEWEDCAQKEPLPLCGGMSDGQNDEPLSWEFQNNLGYVGEVGIYAEDKEVGIGVEDDYYNFQIPFDKFLEIAEKVKEQQ